MKTQLSIIMIALGLALTAPVYASEVSGTLCSGLNCSIDGVVIVSPVAHPIAGTYTAMQSVILTAVGASSIRYTTNGTEPSCPTTGTLYSVAISVASTQTIKALSCYPNNKFSSVASFAYVINIPVTGEIGGGGGGGGGGGAVTPVTKTSALSPSAQKVDANKDGKINVLDFALLMSNWGKTGSNISDSNNDSKIDIFDFALLMASWGT